MDYERTEAMVFKERAQELLEAAKSGKLALETFATKYALNPATVIAILKMVCAIGQPLFDEGCPIINNM